MIVPGRAAWLVLISLVGLPGFAQAAPKLEDLLVRIREVDREGKGNVQASAAVRAIIEGGNAASLIPILKAMDGAQVRAVNWLRSAGDAIVDKVISQGGKLPSAELEAFVLDTKHDGRSRRTAYEWLTLARPDTPDRLVSRFTNDPAQELRRDAIAFEIKKAEDQAEKDPAAATKLYHAAFEAARDADQVKQIAAALEKLGKTVNVAAHLGMVEHWHLLAPFDNKDAKCFEVAYPPEKGVDLSAKLKGKDGKEIAWLRHEVKDPEKATDPNKIGIVDLNKAIAKHKDAIGYAFTIVDSPREQPVEVRVGTYNAVKVFLNGKELISLEEYHHGMKLDQYVGLGTLKKGRNELLVKLCQDDEKESYAQNWNFQLRLCDALGGAVPFEVVTAKKE